MTTTLVSPRTACKRCGGTTYYTKARVTGFVYTHHNMDGSEADNTGMYDTIKEQPGRTAYCSECGVRIGLVNHSCT